MSVSSTKRLREMYNGFTKEHFSKDLGALSPQQKTEGLIRFYIEKIHNPRSEWIDNDAIEEGLVDGSGDLGADFIHKDGNRVLILQSKFHGKSHDGAKLDDILNFRDCLNRLLNPTWKGNKKLQEIRDLLDFKNDEFSLLFLCLGKIQNQAKDKSEQPIDFTLEGLSDRVSIEYWDEQKIAEEYRAADTIGESTDRIAGTLYSAPLSPSSGNRTPIVKIETQNGQSYILITQANQVIDIYRKTKDNLFSLNIRNYLGDTRNNKSIRETAEKEPDDFFLFNNGISCLAKKVKLEEQSSKISFEGLQVINGAQSVKALVKAAKSFGPKQPLILVRITEIGKQYGEEGKLRENIIRYNNTQTTIKSADFRSNDPVQNDLRGKFGKLTKNNKKVQYINKRTDPRKEPSAVKIRMEDFAKVIYAFLGDYTEFAHNTNFLFDAQKKGYKTVFGDGQEIYEREMPSDKFQLRACIWWISDAFEQQRKIDRKNLKEQDNLAWNALERKWLLLYAAGVIFKKELGEKWENWLCKGHKGDWEFGENRFGKDVERVYTASKKMVIARYKEDCGKPGFEHRDWFKKKHTQEGLKNYIENFVDLDLL